MPKFKCPRCSAAIDAEKDELGIVACSSCGARLRTRTPTKMSVRTAPEAHGASEPVAASDEQNSGGPGAPIGPVDDEMPGQRPGEQTIRSQADPGSDPNATHRGLMASPIPRPGTLGSGGTPDATDLGRVLAEIRAVRQAQEQILALLQGRSPQSPPSTEGPPGLKTGPPRAVRRSGGGRRVLVVDDDPQTRDLALTALRGAAMTVKAVANGKECIDAIVHDKPDVVVLEVALAGVMPAKDVINMIKATMDWVDIPLVLYTRAAVGDDPDSLQQYSAESMVMKGPGAPEKLCALVGALLPQP